MKSKEELIPLLTRRAEELLRNAYNLGMKDPSALGYLKDEVYDRGYRAGKANAMSNSEYEIQSVYQSGMELAWALVGSLAQTPKIKRRELFGCSRLSEIVILYTPYQVAQKLNIPMLINKQTTSIRED